MLRITLAAATTAATTAAQAVPVTDFTGLTVQLTQNKVDPATVGRFPDTLIQFEGAAAGGPASAIIGPGIAIEDVALFQARGNPNYRLAVDIDIDAAGLVTFTGASTMNLFWDLSIQTPDVLLTGASQLGQPLWRQCGFFEVVCDVSVESGTARLQFEGPSSSGSLGFSTIGVLENEVLSAQLSADGPMADGYGTTAVPLPAGLPLLLTGLAALGLYSRRRRRT